MGSEGAIMKKILKDTSYCQGWKETKGGKMLRFEINLKRDRKKERNKERDRERDTYSKNFVFDALPQNA